jgi:2-dehydro-3-deoxy-D-pentonate aldolase
METLNTVTRKALRGIVPPMVTPLAGPDALDVPGLERLVEHVIAGGVHGLFVLGTTGEGPALSYRLRREVIRRTCAQVANRIPVLVGTIDTTEAEILALANIAAEAGAHSVVVAPPYYLALSQNDLIRAVESIVRQSPLPIFIYNVPNPGLLRFSLQALKTCADIPGVIGFKDSSGDLSFLHQALDHFRDRPEFSILVGPEPLLAKSLLYGGHGGVSGGANVFPELYVALYNAYREGRLANMWKLQSQVDDFTKRVYAIGELESGLLRGLKCCLSLLGICESRLCSPFKPAEDRERDEVARVLDDCMVNAALWKPPGMQKLTREN